MTNEIKKMLIESRIALLTVRGSHNDKIVRKLKRQLRKLEN